MSSADAKALLETEFPGTQAKEWKRRSKRKVEDGHVRVFFHPSHGEVEIHEDRRGQCVCVGQTKNVSEFVAPAFSVEQVNAARKLMAAYYRLSEVGDDALENLSTHKLYALGGHALGTQLAFYFPSMTYGNEEATVAGLVPTLDDPVGDFCVMIFDPTPGAEPDLYGNNVILDALTLRNIDLVDEYHAQSTDTERTVRQFVQELIGLGLRYVPDHPDHEEPCLFGAQLTAAGAKNPRLAQPQAQSESQFTTPQFNEQQVQAARALLGAYYRLASGQDEEGEYDEDEEPCENIKSHALYGPGVAAIGTQFAFHFPNNTYSNTQGLIGSLDDPIGDFCVLLFDPAPGSEPDLYGNLLLWDAMTERGLARRDEYHVGCLDPQRSVRQVVQDLLDMGVRYVPEHARSARGVVLDDLLTAAGARSPVPVATPGGARSPKP